MAKRSHKVIFDANDRFISEADVKLNTASVSNAHQEVIQLSSKNYTHTSKRT